jgi:hypothetical protein
MASDLSMTAVRWQRPSGEVAASESLTQLGEGSDLSAAHRVYCLGYC